MKINKFQKDKYWISTKNIPGSLVEKILYPRWSKNNKAEKFASSKKMEIYESSAKDPFEVQKKFAGLWNFLISINFSTLVSGEGIPFTE